VALFSAEQPRIRAADLSKKKKRWAGRAPHNFKLQRSDAAGSRSVPLFLVIAGNMATTTGQGWSQLRQQARSLELQTEASLQTYSQFSTQTAIPPKPTEEEKKAEAKVQELLNKVSVDM
jgi:hypothetical protein